MRYILRLVVPALIFVGALYLLTRGRRHDRTPGSRPPSRGPGSDAAPFIVILIVSAAVALGTAYLLESLWEGQ